MDKIRHLKTAAQQFAFEGEPVSCEPFGSGHINDTFLLRTELPDGSEVAYILQRLNRSVFHDPAALMENVCGITGWLKRRIADAGGDPTRETLSLIDTKGGESFYVDPDGEYWRAYLYIRGTVSYDAVRSPEDFYQSALVFGQFQQLLADYPADTLHETIPHFHDTVDRYEKFEAAVRADACGRAASVADEIAFVRSREELTHVLVDQQASGALPLRVTHNDTKLNNILMDEKSGRAVCVIDLDTVMPGLSVNDFGDAIRFGASTAAEDERDLEKVSCDLKLYELYVKGFIEGCAGALTDQEISMLPTGALLMTLECGMRFLTDYLEGDHYFKIARENHNLDRARTQFRLVEDMELKMPKMRQIVDKYR